MARRPNQDPMAGIPIGAREQGAKLANHVIKVNRADGRAVEAAHIGPVAKGDLTEMHKIASSVIQHNENHPAKKLMAAIRTSHESNRNTLTPGNFEDIKYVLKSAVKILKDTPSIVNVDSPCYVFGDIHGNLGDLIWFEREFWPRAPSACPANYVFLGDYVDRGDFGLHCALYLIGMKVLNSKDFHLLRGNHEVREIQERTSFKRECLVHLGNQLGLIVWEFLNQVFDYLPMGAVISKNIYAAHGGIPCSEMMLPKVSKMIQRPLPNPENCDVAWEILWNDPLDDEGWAEQLARHKDANKTEHPDLYIRNYKRGTAYYFNEKCTDLFLKRNGLSHILRAHEDQDIGFAFNHHGKTITIFSSSRYCGKANKAAIILVKDGKIRPLQIQDD